MLKDLNEQVRKHKEVLGELKDELEEYTHLMSLCERKDEGNNTASNNMVVKLLGKSVKVKAKIEDRQRMLDGKIERRSGWLDGKRLVARRRIQKVLDRSMSLEDLIVTETSVEGLDEAIRLSGEWNKFLVAKKELAVMVSDVFDGEDELREADEELLVDIQVALMR